MNKVYYDYETKNTSFLEMNEYLKGLGIKNNNFMLAIYNKDLIGVDPYDPNLTSLQKIDIIKECMMNIWYYLREVAKLPSMSNDRGIRFKLDKVNCAQVYCFCNYLNSWVSKPRQLHKLTDTLIIINWINLFHCNTISMIRKTKTQTLRNEVIIEKLKKSLPDYIPSFYKNNIIKIGQINSIEKADNLARSLSTPICYFEDAEFIKYIRTIYENMIPIHTQTKINAKRKGEYAGIMFTSVYSDNPEMEDLVESLLRWDDSFYDLTIKKIKDILDNHVHQIIHIKYSYQELGYDEDWFKEQCILLNNDQDVIRREILLQRKSKE